MSAYLHKLIGRYPERELEILRLFRDSSVFRSICEEMEMAEAAEARWIDIPERASEYRSILDRLRDEFLENLSGGTRQGVQGNVLDGGGSDKSTV